MTNEEAIEIIKIAKAEVEWDYPMDYQIAFDKAIEALEKQIPKKPFVENELYACPHCRAVLAFSLCCPYCDDCAEKFGGVYTDSVTGEKVVYKKNK